MILSIGRDRNMVWDCSLATNRPRSKRLESRVARNNEKQLLTRDEQAATTRRRTGCGGATMLGLRPVLGVGPDRAEQSVYVTG